VLKSYLYLRNMVGRKIQFLAFRMYQMEKCNHFYLCNSYNLPGDNIYKWCATSCTTTTILRNTALTQNVRNKWNMPRWKPRTMTLEYHRRCGMHSICGNRGYGARNYWTPKAKSSMTSNSGHFVVTYGYYASSPICRGGLPLRPLPYFLLRSVVTYSLCEVKMKYHEKEFTL